MQTTLRDEYGTYCSRPDATAQGLPAGDMFALEAHKRTKLPCVVAISGGCLSLIAQDREFENPRGTKVDHIATIKKYIEDGLVEPAIGGLAGHRMLYFQAETNAFALQTGITLLENILGGTAPVVYPNSRVYAATPNIDDAILGSRISKPMMQSTEAGIRRFVASTDSNSKVRYVVVDQQGFSKDNIKGSRPDPIWEGRGARIPVAATVQAAPRSSASVCAQLPEVDRLFIDFDTKNNMLLNDPPDGDGNEAWQAGKFSLNMRKELIYGFAEQGRTRRGLLVYSDDIEKFAGNGWFDGDYNGTEIDWIGIATAALEWIAAHPWISVVTTADLDPRTDGVGTVFVEGAIDPSIHQDDPKVPEESWARPIDGLIVARRVWTSIPGRATRWRARTGSCTAGGIGVWRDSR